MDSTSPAAARIAGQTSDRSGSSFKPFFAEGTFTLVENTFVGRRWNLDREDGSHRRHRDYQRRSAAGHGHAS